MREEKNKFEKRVNDVYKMCELEFKKEEFDFPEVKDFDLPNEVFEKFEPKNNSNYTVVDKKFW